MDINLAILDIDNNRVGFLDENDKSSATPGSLNATGKFSMFGLKSGDKINDKGRFPAQMFISTDIGNMIDEQSDKGGASKILNKIDFTEEDEY